jgi:pimeloyl-ACP methyl ester carboxylesterase
MDMLHHRTAGEGPPLLLIHGAAEDVDLLAPQAEAFAARGRRVIWADRRGTGRSPRDRWPSTVEAHADDAADLLRALDAAPATVLGFSSGGIVAIALAARHPGLVREAIAWEPPLISLVPGGMEIHAGLLEPIEAYLAEHPGDWTGGYRVMLDTLSGGRADHDAPVVRAMRRNAEAALRDDAVIITRHAFAPGDLKADRVAVAVSAAPDPLHAAIAAAFTEATGRAPLVVDVADDHEVYLHRPAVLADAVAPRW